MSGFGTVRIRRGRGDKGDDVGVVSKCGRSRVKEPRDKVCVQGWCILCGHLLVLMNVSVRVVECRSMGVLGGC